MVELLLSGIKTPIRPSSPENSYLTEKDVFEHLNENILYNQDSVMELKKLYNELLDENERLLQANEWDLSLDSLKDKINNIVETGEINKQNMLFKLNNIISGMSFSSHEAKSSRIYAVW